MSESETYDETPRGLYLRWKTELEAARKASETFRNDGAMIVARFLDKRNGNGADLVRWNYFSANIITLEALLYGRPPSVSVSRRFADASDDTARVASEALERLLNTDIESDDDSYALALNYALEDRLLPGLSVVRVRYEPRFGVVPAVPAQMRDDGTELAPAVPESERLEGEEVEVDYVHWQDFLWSPCRVWPEVRWVAFRALMSRDQLVERFGEEIGRAVPLNAKGSQSEDTKTETPWARAEVWEVWCKESRRVYWVSEGYPAMLDIKDDPLGLDGFFPCPRPMVANSTTTALMPRADYMLAKDLYNEIDSVGQRITLLERAIRVTGVYDKANDGLKQILDPRRVANDLYPVDNWAMFAERGGIQGAIAWLPLDQIVGALTALRDYRRELVDSLFELSGMSDIMRGQASVAGSTATEQRIKSRSASLRVQALQNDFARFASDVQKLKAEIICKHFAPQTIIERCNLARGPDADKLPAAVELLKSNASAYRVEVKADAIAMADFDAQKSERMEVLATLATFFQAAAPVAQQIPNSMPYLLQMLQWTMSGLRGSSTMEGILDQAIAAAQEQQKAAAMNPQQGPPPDPKLLALQLKGQQDLAKTQADLQADLIRTQAETQADAQREQTQAEWNTREAAAKRAISATGRGFGGGGVL